MPRPVINEAARARRAWLVLAMTAATFALFAAALLLLLFPD